MFFTFKPMDEASALVVLAWHYKSPYDFYNSDLNLEKELLKCLLDPKNAYYALYNTRDEIVAFCCFGEDAQVLDGDYTEDALDIGLGVRPDLTGRGWGIYFVRSVLDFARQNFQPARVRVTIAGFNQRARRVWENAGFVEVQTFRRKRDDLLFVVMALTETTPE